MKTPRVLILLYQSITMPAWANVGFPRASLWVIKALKRAELGESSPRPGLSGGPAKMFDRNAQTPNPNAAADDRRCALLASGIDTAPLLDALKRVPNTRVGGHLHLSRKRPGRAGGRLPHPRRRRRNQADPAGTADRALVGGANPRASRRAGIEVRLSGRSRAARGRPDPAGGRSGLSGGKASAWHAKAIRSCPARAKAAAAATTTSICSAG